MPREQKKRGRREAQKRRRDESDEVSPSSSKRRRTQAGEPHQDASTPDFTALQNGTNEDEYEGPDGQERRFYGLLDEEEHEYFRNADQMLEVNQFRDVDERSLFIENLHKEADGKELKLACEQTGSRLLERLILLSKPDQLKGLFQKFNGEYIHLMSHRFASHCCETLFKASAPLVSEEFGTLPVKHENSVDTSIESLLLGVLNELDDNLGYMITNKFASHTLRVLLLVLSGYPLNKPETKSIHKSQHKALVASKRNAKVSIDGASHIAPNAQSELMVPQSFSDSLLHIIQTLSSTLDTTTLRILATERIANPTLQLLLRLESTVYGKQRGSEAESMLRKLLPDDPITTDTDSAKFVSGIVFDPVGSHLVQAIVQYAPGKIFKALYREVFKDHLLNLAQHDTASYVVCQILERLGAEDLRDASNQLISEMPLLLERNRTNILRTLAERLAVRKVNPLPFIDAFTSACSTDDAQHLSISKLLHLPLNLTDEPASAEIENTLAITTSASQNAASVLTQALLPIHGPLSAMVFDALSNADFKYIRCIAHTSPLSPILQSALTVDTASVIFRRKLITRFYGSIAEFSASPSASHVVDAIERGSRKDLAFVRERVAEELSESEAVLRESRSGRKVWKNWNMDLYRRDRERWIKETRKKVGNNGFQSFPGLLGEAHMSAKEKGKGSLNRIAATAREGLHAAGEMGSQVHQKVHEEVCEPIRLTGKSALDRARERFALRQHQQG